ncbi:MAG: heparinase II/III family protein, partial [Oscillospiraceae bacterium]|nr:heparinase II/III family protein [Oscillospiraceae bacterium]
MFRRLLSLLLLAAILLQLVPSVMTQASATTTATVDPSAKDILDVFNLRSRGQHPRILADSAKFEKIRKLCEGDPYMRTWYEGIYDYGEWILRTPLADYSAMYSYAKTASDRIINLSFLYRLSGERRFADQAVMEMLAVVSHETWTKDTNCLIIALAAYGLGIGYDWLYDYMSQTDRETISEGIYTYVIHKLLTTKYWWVNTYCNINPWTYGLASIAALAIIEDYPEACSELLAQGVSSVRNYIPYLAPGGAFVEGGGYYRAVMISLTMMLDNLNCVLGTDFDLSKEEGLLEAAKYLPAMSSDVATFNHGDCQPAVYSGPFLYWFANQYDLPELYLWQRSKTAAVYRNAYMKDHFLSMLWYDSSYIEGYTQEEAQKDYFLNSEDYESYASFRGTLSDGKELYAAIKGGKHNLYHSDMDAGTFVLDAMGIRWFEDLGKGDYEASGYFTYEEAASRWTYYRKRAEGQNTLLINPQAPNSHSNYGGQDADADCQITEYSSAYDGGYALVDMTSAYDNHYSGSTVQRGLALFDNRSRVLLRDEIRCTKNSEIYWFAHTKAKIQLSEDRKTAKLMQNGKTLIAQLVCPAPATFSVMDAAPLPTSPNPSGQADNSSYQKLTIHLTNVNSTDIEVIFTPILSEIDKTKSLPNVSIEMLSTLLSPYAEGTSLPNNSKGDYEIYTADQLFLFAEMVNNGSDFSGKTVKLMKDIDLRSRTFLPIGGGSNDPSDRGCFFSGIFDGCSHEIRNLLIYAPGKHYVGLFGATMNATIRNLGVDRCKVYGGTKTACLDALGINTTIEDCFTRGDAVSSGADAGGLCAQVSGSIRIANSYHNGKVKSTRYCGGLLGYVSSKSTLTMENCYYTGKLRGEEGFTGMLGFYSTEGVYAVTALELRNCYATGALKGTAIRSGSIDSYTDCLTITEAALVSYAVQLGGSFIYDCEWENDGYPVLNRQCDVSLPEDYVITTEAQLRFLAYQVNSGADSFIGKVVTLGRDIDLKLHEWTPIGGNRGDGSTGITFRGTLDGKGHIVSNLKISSGHSFVGLLGYVRGATIRNLGLEKSVIHGKTGAGLVGYAYTGTKIHQCYNTAAISGYSGVGGILGMVGGQNCEIVDCYYTGTLAATVTGAGILGNISSDCKEIAVRNSYCTGSVPYGILGNVHAAAVSCSIHNSYCVSPCSLVGYQGSLVITNSSSQSADKLRTYVSVLGSSYTADCPRYNQGFPILLWQHARKAVTTDAIAPTCTTAGKTAGKHCALCKAVLVAQQTVPATGHSYSYTKVNGLLHLVTCKNCDFSTETAHSYKEGYCICGEPEVKEPVEDTNLKLNHSLNLASDISVNLLVSKSLLEGFDMSTVYVESTVDCYEGNRQTGTSTLRIEPVLNGNYCYFTLNGLTAVQMNDRISSVLYGMKDGQPYCSPVDEYSIASYAYSQMNNPDRPESLKVLCADLLRYGAKAQIFKSYRTDALADANMTSAHKSYLSDMEAVTFGNTNKVLNDVANAPITWAGKALDLESKVALKFVFNPVNYKG